jgi:hypothetical protein
MMLQVFSAALSMQLLTPPPGGASAIARPAATAAALSIAADNAGSIAGSRDEDEERHPAGVVDSTLEDEEGMPSDATRSGRSRVGRLRRNGHYIVLVPSIRVESSFGVEFGTSGRYVYRPPGRTINMVLLSLQNRVSTKLVQEHELILRLRDLFGKRELFLFDARFIDDPRFTYAGIANPDKLTNEELEEDPYFRVKVRTFGGRVGYQHPLWRSGEALPTWFHSSILSIIGTYRFEMDQANFRDDSMFAMEQGAAAKTTRRSSLTLGLVYDARNREVSPVRGSYHELSVEWAAPWLGATQSWGRINAAARWFIPMGTERAILALRVGGETQLGTPPYFILGQFGGVDAFDGFGGRMVGRGFYRRRFIGKHKVYGSPEFRFVPLKTMLGRYKIDVGLNLFSDLGGIWDQDVNRQAGFQISGGGGIFLRLDDFFVVRTEASGSREGFQLYLATDHAF